MVVTVDTLLHPILTVTTDSSPTMCPMSTLAHSINKIAMLMLLLTHVHLLPLITALTYNIPHLGEDVRKT